MKIEIKYEIGDSLWFVADDKIINLPVENIKYEYRPAFFNKLRTTYTFFERKKDYVIMPHWNETKCYIKEEDEVYKTKEELLKNL